MKLIYNVKTGEIYGCADKDVNIMRRYRDYPKEILYDLGEIIKPNIQLEPWEYINYKVVNGLIAKRPDEEILELRQYGKILTEEERLCKNIENQLKPSPDEVQKAKNTIEVLELLQEVM